MHERGLDRVRRGAGHVVGAGRHKRGLGCGWDTLVGPGMCGWELRHAKGAGPCKRGLGHAKGGWAT